MSNIIRLERKRNAPTFQKCLFNNCSVNIDIPNISGYEFNTNFHKIYKIGFITEDKGGIRYLVISHFIFYVLYVDLWLIN